MENCYKMYTWLCRTLVALMLEMFWKMRQISDYFSSKQCEEHSILPPLPSEITPLTAEHKYRRHIRSMSDVQRSTPLYTVPVSSLRRISQPILYESETRIKRMRIRERYTIDSSDSAEEAKTRSLERRLKRHKTSKDTMRYL